MKKEKLKLDVITDNSLGFKREGWVTSSFWKQQPSHIHRARPRKTLCLPLLRKGSDGEQGFSTIQTFETKVTSAEGKESAWLTSY